MDNVGIIFENKLYLDANVRGLCTQTWAINGNGEEKNNSKQEVVGFQVRRLSAASSSFCPSLPPVIRNTLIITRQTLFNPSICRHVALRLCLCACVRLAFTWSSHRANIFFFFFAFTHWRQTLSSQSHTQTHTHVHTRRKAPSLTSTPWSRHDADYKPAGRLQRKYQLGVTFSYTRTLLRSATQLLFLCGWKF